MAVALHVAGVVVLVVAAILAAALPRSSRERPSADPVLTSVQLGLAGALLVAALVLGFAVAVDAAHPAWLGLPLALGPGLAVSAGLLGFAAVPTARLPRGPGRTRTAGDRRAYLLPGAAAAALTVFLLTTGATADPDDRGLSRALSVTTAAGGTSTTPYPGWFYALPLLALTVLLLGATFLAMRRIATLPALVSGDDDRRCRRAATAAISSLATSGLLAYLAGTVFVTAHALRWIAASSGDDRLLASLLADVLLLLALLLTAGTCAGLVRAATVALTFRALTRPKPCP